MTAPCKVPGAEDILGAISYLSPPKPSLPSRGHLQGQRAFACTPPDSHVPGPHVRSRCPRVMHVRVRAGGGGSTTSAQRARVPPRYSRGGGRRITSSVIALVTQGVGGQPGLHEALFCLDPTSGTGSHFASFFLVTRYVEQAGIELREKQNVVGLGLSWSSAGTHKAPGSIHSSPPRLTRARLSSQQQEAEAGSKVQGRVLRGLISSRPA